MNNKSRCLYVLAFFAIAVCWYRSTLVSLGAHSQGDFVRIESAYPNDPSPVAIELARPVASESITIFNVLDAASGVDAAEETSATESDALNSPVTIPLLSVDGHTLKKIKKLLMFVHQKRYTQLEHYLALLVARKPASVLNILLASNYLDIPFLTAACVKTIAYHIPAYNLIVRHDASGSPMLCSTVAPQEWMRLPHELIVEIFNTVMTVPDDQIADTLRSHVGHIRHEILALAYSADNLSIIVCDDQAALYKISLATGQRIGDVGRIKIDSIIAAELSGSGDRVAFMRYDNNVSVYDVDSQRKLLEAPKPVRAMALSNDGATIALLVDNQIEIYDINTSTLVHESNVAIGGDLASPYALAYSNDGQHVGIFSPHAGAYVYTIATATLQHVVNGDKKVMCMCFSPDNIHLALGLHSGGLIICDKAGKAIVEQQAHVGPVFTVGYSNSATTLASSGADAQLRLWEVATQRERCALSVDNQEAAIVRFSPHDKTIAASLLGGGGLCLWSLCKPSVDLLTDEVRDFSLLNFSR